MLINKKAQTMKRPQQTTNYMTPLSSRNSNKSVSMDRTTCFPLIGALSEQNKFFKHQHALMAQQLQQLQKISEELHLENTSLRKHYRQRTIDVVNLIKTFELNTHEENTDYHHRAHLIREANCGLLKRIKELMNQIAQTQEKIEQKKNLDRIENENKHELEQINLNKVKARLASNLNPECIKKMKATQKNLFTGNENLMKEIDELIISNTLLGKNNYQNLKEWTLVKASNSNERYSLREQIIHIAQLLVSLREEKQKLQNDLEKHLQINEAANGKHQMSLQRYRKVTRTKEQLNAKLCILQNQKDILKNAIIGQEKSKNTSQASLNLAIEQKQQLLNKKNQKLKAIQELSKGLSNRIDDVNAQHSLKLRGIRNQIGQIQEASLDEISQMRAEKSQICQRIDSSNKQFNLLCDDISEYERILKGLNDPIAQIERAELILRLKRKPLSQVR